MKGGCLPASPSNPSPTSSQKGPLEAKFDLSVTCCGSPVPSGYGLSSVAWDSRPCMACPLSPHPCSPSILQMPLGRTLPSGLSTHLSALVPLPSLCLISSLLDPHSKAQTPLLQEALPELPIPSLPTLGYHCLGVALPSHGMVNPVRTGLGAVSVTDTSLASLVIGHVLSSYYLCC